MSPLLREFIVWLNDDLPHRYRQMLRPYLGRMVGTRDDGHDAARLAALYAYTMDTPVGTALARPVSSVAKTFQQVENYLGRRVPELADGLYYARAAAAVAASRREVPHALLEALLPTVPLDVEVKPASLIG